MMARRVAPIRGLNHRAGDTRHHGECLSGCLSRGAGNLSQVGFTVRVVSQALVPLRGAQRAPEVVYVAR